MTSKNIAIVTDSVASIPENLLESLKITTVAYYIHRSQEVFRDLVSMKRDTFYHWMKSAKQLPTTACPGIGDYVTTYDALADEGVEEIISIHMSSKGSGAYQAALAAVPIANEKRPDLKIEVIDTLNVSMCQGWIVIEAARAAMAGSAMKNILQLIQELIPKTRMIQTADTLKYLHMGGRIGRAKHLVGTLLNIKPLISMENGEIVALGQERSRKRAYQAIAKLVEKAASSNPVKIAYVHASALEEARKIKFEIEKRVNIIESNYAELSPALGVHSGPGTAGVCFYPVT